MWFRGGDGEDRLPSSHLISFKFKELKLSSHWPDSMFLFERGEEAGHSKIILFKKLF